MYTPNQPRVLAVSGKALPQWAGQPALTVTEVNGREKLGKLYEYTIDLKTHHAPAFPVYKARELVDASKLIGTELSLSIAFDGKGQFIPGLPGNLGVGNVGAGTRTITGIVTRFVITGEDDKHVYYRAIVRPWLWLATRNRENRLFQNSNVVQITEAVLKSKLYPFQYELRLGAPGLRGIYPKRDYVRQMWESDHRFLTRLWREWGIYYFMEGSTLVLCDSPGGHRQHENMYDSVRYQALADARIDEEHIHQLDVAHAITSGAVVLTDYDPTLSRARLTDKVERESFAAFDNAEHYGWGEFSQPRAGAQGLEGPSNDFETEAHYLAGVRADALRARQMRLKGQGNLRGLAVGHTFYVTDHPDRKVNAEYLVIGMDLHIRNNGETSGESAYVCRNDFVLQSANAFFKNRPKKKPQCGPETAVVVGPDEQPMWVDGYARAKVQFIWDRLGQKDEQSSCWVRVSSPWQGSNYGFIALPRIGQEVTISYHEGDPDKPYIADRQVNDFNQPPWELPKNQALTGLRSRSLEGSQSNQIVTDDTPGKLQVQVASDHANSRLVLGFNTRIEGDEGRREARGEGFELATEAWGVARANKGMLITTEARQSATVPAKAMGESIQRLISAREQHESLAIAAQQNLAQDLNADQSDVAAAIRTQNQTLLGRDGRGSDETFPEFSEPQLAFASPAGIESTTPATTHISSGQHVALTSGQHVSISAGERLLASVRNGIRLFCQKMGVKLIAASGDIDIQALSDGISILAKLKITQTADNISITANKEIIINGAGSYTKWNADGVETGTNGQWILHSAGRSMDGPKSIESNIPVTSILKEGPHSIAVMAMSAAGDILKDAVVSIFGIDKIEDQIKEAAKNKAEEIEAEIKQGASDIYDSASEKVHDAYEYVLDSVTGITEEIKRDSNRMYQALVGYDGWTAQFSPSTEDYVAYDPGVLEEDRSVEAL